MGHLLWDKTKDFLQRAFTVIFIASIVIWVLQSFDWRFRLVDPENSMLAAVAGVIAPLFAPLGLGDWRIVTALVTGFLAKESVVATLEVLNVTTTLTALTAIPMLAFCLLYTPCVAAIAAVKRELGGNGRSSWWFSNAWWPGSWPGWRIWWQACSFNSWCHESPEPDRPADRPGGAVLRAARVLALPGEGRLQLRGGL